MALSLDLDGRIVPLCAVARGGIGGAPARRLAAAGATIFAVDHVQALLDEAIGDVGSALSADFCAGSAEPFKRSTHRGAGERA